MGRVGAVGDVTRDIHVHGVSINPHLLVRIRLLGERDLLKQALLRVHRNVRRPSREIVGPVAEEDGRRDRGGKEGCVRGGFHVRAGKEAT